ncbi:MAG: RlmE family RNA methyltransferase [Alphaproteobacteria bacterium]|nr:RlmE family RNA methyltransferase [Alphaproteobacteria bacterium]
MAGEGGRPRHRGRGGANRSGPPGRQGAAIRVRSARHRRPSSTGWLSRQLNDPYVAEAKRLGYRSRSAFKLIQLDDRFRLLSPGHRILDLGCAPGGWTQVAVERVGALSGRVVVVGVDIAEAAPIPGAALLRADIREPAVLAAIKAELGDLADVVLSDMAPSAIGHAATDHLRIVALAEAAWSVAEQILKPGGTFVAKVFQGGAEGALLARLKQAFAQLRHAKPAASRAESAETYVIGKGFRAGE